jgi:hypothetical protein
MRLRDMAEYAPARLAEAALGALPCWLIGSALEREVLRGGLVPGAG